MKTKFLLFGFLLILLVGSVSAATIPQRYTLDFFGINGILNTTTIQTQNLSVSRIDYTGGLPAECALTNSWIYYFNFTASRCMTINYQAFPVLTVATNFTITDLSGAGNVHACLDANGKLYRGNTTGCP